MSNRTLENKPMVASRERVEKQFKEAIVLGPTYTDVKKLLTPNDEISLSGRTLRGWDQLNRRKG